MPDAAQLKAIQLTLALQVLRTDNDPSLNDLCATGIEALDKLADGAHERLVFNGIALPHELLGFPSIGMFGVSLVGAAGALCIPIRPSYFIVGLPRREEARLDWFVEAAEKTPIIFAGLSLGLEPTARVVLPPSFYGREEDALRDQLKEIRAAAISYRDGVQAFNQVVHGTNFAETI